jgi:hypothetical protein
MVRVTSLSRIVFGTSAALIIATAALAQTSSSTPTPGSPSAVEAPQKSEGLIARAKAKTQASIARVKKNLADVRARQACRKEAAEQNIAKQDRLEYIRACAHKLAKKDAGPNVLPALFISPEALKPNLGGMTATGDGGAMIDHGSQKKK